MKDYPYERYLRDSRILLIFEASMNMLFVLPETDRNTHTFCKPEVKQIQRSTGLSRPLSDSSEVCNSWNKPEELILFSLVIQVVFFL